MKYIHNSETFQTEFDRLLDRYDRYSWMVAWAGRPGRQRDFLFRNSNRIEKIVVGTHFYQTDPDFIEQFNTIEGVRFIKRPSGVFHPKVYLFHSSDSDWEAIITSANFTNGAFNRNNEAGILITARETPLGIYVDLKNSIADAWNSGQKYSESELAEYRLMAKATPDERNPAQVSNPGGPSNVRISVPIESMTWRQYIDRILSAASGQLLERIAILDTVQEYFRTYETFAEMPELYRKQIGGYVQRDQPFNFHLFGNMLNATAFASAINLNPGPISEALAVIPIDGPVLYQEYLEFVALFHEALGGGNKYRSATRLLAMKRPDIFFALSLGNNMQAQADFRTRGITTMNLSRYWPEIVIPIQRSLWWRVPDPMNDQENSIMKYRAAFLDVMYYLPPYISNGALAEA